MASIGALLDPSVAGVIVQSPNRYGFIEDYAGLGETVHASGGLLAISSDPLSLVLQRPQGEWDADIAIGDTQPLGLPPAFGGPTCGYMAVRESLMRKMPGRIVGQTMDLDGKRAFTLTLQAREQHIKRERATSNICSNQALAALTTTIHVSLVGYAGCSMRDDRVGQSPLSCGIAGTVRPCGHRWNGTLLVRISRGLRFG